MYKGVTGLTYFIEKTTDVKHFVPNFRTLPSHPVGRVDLAPRLHVNYVNDTDFCTKASTSIVSNLVFIPHFKCLVLFVLALVNIKHGSQHS